MAPFTGSISRDGKALLARVVGKINIDDGAGLRHCHGSFQAPEGDGVVAGRLYMLTLREGPTAHILITSRSRVLQGGLEFSGTVC